MTREHPRRRSSRDSSRRRNRRRSRDFYYSNPAAPSASRAAESAYSTNQRIYRRDSRSSLSSSSSSSYQDISRYSPPSRHGNFFATFFRAPSEHQRRARRRARTRILPFGNSSSSSVDSDLAYGAGFVRRPRGSRQHTPQTQSQQPYSQQHYNDDRRYAEYQYQQGYTPQSGYDPRYAPNATPQRYPSGQYYDQQAFDPRYAPSHDPAYSQHYPQPPTESRSHVEPTTAMPTSYVGPAIGAGLGLAMASSALGDRDDRMRRDDNDHDRDHDRREDRDHRHARSDREGRHTSSVAESTPRPARLQRRGTDEEIMELGRSLTRLHSDIESRPTGLLPGNSRSGDSRRVDRDRGVGSSRPYDGPYSSDGDDDDGEWESVSSDSSKEDLLAYGSAVPGPQTPPHHAESPLVETPPRAFSRRSDLVDPRYFGPQNSLNGFVSPLPSGHPTSSVPMRHVEAMPMDDERGSVQTPTQVYPKRSTPTEVQLEQPKPVAPVSPQRLERSSYAEQSERRVPSGESNRQTSSGSKVLTGAAIASAAGIVGHTILSEDKKKDKDLKLARAEEKARREERERREAKEEEEEAERKKKLIDAEYEEYLRSVRRETSRDRKRRERHEDAARSHESRRVEPKEPSDGPEGSSRQLKSADDYRDYRRVTGDARIGTKAPIDPFQFQVADDAFQTPTYSRPATPDREKEVAPDATRVVTVDREPSMSPPRLSRKDSFEMEKMVEEARKSDHQRFEEEEAALMREYKAMRAAAAAEPDDSIAASYVDDEPKTRGRSAKDPVLEEADEFYRKSRAARRVAAEEIRSRSTSPNSSVVGKWEEHEEYKPEFTIVNPPEEEVEDLRKSGPYSEPNADVTIATIFEHPEQLSRFLEDRFRSRKEGRSARSGPETELEGPLIVNITRPTPPSSPSIERRRQKEKDRAARARSRDRSQSRPRKADESEAAADRGVSSPNVVIGPRGEIVNLEEDQPTEQERVDVPGRPGVRSLESFERPNTPVRSGWKVVNTDLSGRFTGPEWGELPRDEVAADEATRAVDLPEIGPVEEEPATRTREFNGSRPETFPKKPVDYESSADRRRKESPWDRDVPYDRYADLPPLPESRPDSTRGSPELGDIPGSFGDDLEFAATVGAGLKAAGFDDNIAADDPQYRKRDSPPGFNDELGTTREAPWADEVQPAEDEWGTGLRGKKKKKKAGKKQRPETPPAEPEPETVPDALGERAFDPMDFPEAAQLSRHSDSAERGLDRYAGVPLPSEPVEPAGPADEDSWGVSRKLSKKERNLAKKKAAEAEQPEEEPVRRGPGDEEVMDKYIAPLEDGSRELPIDEPSKPVAAPEHSVPLPEDSPVSRKLSKKERKQLAKKEKVASQFDEEPIPKEDDGEATRAGPPPEKPEDAWNIGESPPADTIEPNADSDVWHEAVEEAPQVEETPKEILAAPEEDPLALPSKKNKKKKKKGAMALETEMDKGHANGHANGHRGKSDDIGQESFLGSAGTLGAGVGLPVAAGLAASAAVTGPHAIGSQSEEAETRGIADRAAGPGSEEAPALSEDSRTVDPDVVPRPVKFVIDPQHGDLLSLPPSLPASPGGSVEEDLPPLPDSRPDTPPEEVYKRELLNSRRRKSKDSSHTRSTSDTSIPLPLLLGQRSNPSSPRFVKQSPTTSPVSSAADSARKSFSRPISWDGKKEIRPLILPTRRGNESPTRSISPMKGLRQLDLADSPTISRGRPESRGRLGSLSDFGVIEEDVVPGESAERAAPVEEQAGNLGFTTPDKKKGKSKAATDDLPESPTPTSPGAEEPSAPNYDQKRDLAPSWEDAFEVPEAPKSGPEGTTEHSLEIADAAEPAEEEAVETEKPVEPISKKDKKKKKKKSLNTSFEKPQERVEAVPEVPSAPLEVSEAPVEGPPAPEIEAVSQPAVEGERSLDLKPTGDVPDEPVQDDPKPVEPAEPVSKKDKKKKKKKSVDTSSEKPEELANIVLETPSAPIEAPEAPVEGPPSSEIEAVSPIAAEGKRSLELEPAGAVLDEPVQGETEPAKPVSKKDKKKKKKSVDTSSEKPEEPAEIVPETPSAPLEVDAPVEAPLTSDIEAVTQPAVEGERSLDLEPSASAPDEPAQGDSEPVELSEPLSKKDRKKKKKMSVDTPSEKPEDPTEAISEVPPAPLEDLEAPSVPQETEAPPEALSAPDAETSVPQPAVEAERSLDLEPAGSVPDQPVQDDPEPAMTKAERKKAKKKKKKGAMEPEKIAEDQPSQIQADTPVEPFSEPPVDLPIGPSTSTDLPSEPPVESSAVPDADEGATRETPIEEELSAPKSKKSKKKKASHASLDDAATAEPEKSPEGQHDRDHQPSEKKHEEQPVVGQPAEEKPAEEQPSEKQLVEEQPPQVSLDDASTAELGKPDEGQKDGDQPAEEKPVEEQQVGDQPAEERSIETPADPTSEPLTEPPAIPTTDVLVSEEPEPLKTETPQDEPAPTVKGKKNKKKKNKASQSSLDITATAPEPEKPLEEQTALEQPIEGVPEPERLSEEQPALEQPIEGVPELEKPSEEQPVFEQPTEGDPELKKPSEEQSATEQPVEGALEPEKPSEEQPALEQPIEGVPELEKLSEEQPSLEQPNETVALPPSELATDTPAPEKSERSMTEATQDEPTPVKGKKNKKKKKASQSLSDDVPAPEPEHSEQPSGEKQSDVHVESGPDALKDPEAELPSQKEEPPSTPKKETIDSSRDAETAGSPQAEQLPIEDQPAALASEPDGMERSQSVDAPPQEAPQMEDPALPVSGKKAKKKKKKKGAVSDEVEASPVAPEEQASAPVDFSEVPKEAASEDVHGSFDSREEGQKESETSVPLAGESLSNEVEPSPVLGEQESAPDQIPETPKEAASEDILGSPDIEKKGDEKLETSVTLEGETLENKAEPSTVVSEEQASAPAEVSEVPETTSADVPATPDSKKEGDKESETSGTLEGDIDPTPPETIDEPSKNASAERSAPEEMQSSRGDSASEKWADASEQLDLKPPEATISVPEEAPSDPSATPTPVEEEGSQQLGKKKKKKGKKGSKAVIEEAQRSIELPPQAVDPVDPVEQPAQAEEAVVSKTPGDDGTISVKGDQAEAPSDTTQPSQTIDAVDPIEQPSRDEEAAISQPPTGDDSSVVKDNQADAPSDPSQPSQTVDAVDSVEQSPRDGDVAIPQPPAGDDASAPKEEQAEPPSNFAPSPAAAKEVPSEPLGKKKKKKGKKGSQSVVEEVPEPSEPVPKPEEPAVSEAPAGEAPESDDISTAKDGPGSRDNVSTEKIPREEVPEAAEAIPESSEQPAGSLEQSTEFPTTAPEAITPDSPKEVEGRDAQTPQETPEQQDPNTPAAPEKSSSAPLESALSGKKSKKKKRKSVSFADTSGDPTADSTVSPMPEKEDHFVDAPAELRTEKDREMDRSLDEAWDDAWAEPSEMTPETAPSSDAPIDESEVTSPKSKKKKKGKSNEEPSPGIGPEPTFTPELVEEPATLPETGEPQALGDASTIADSGDSQATLPAPDNSTEADPTSSSKRGEVPGIEETKKISDELPRQGMDASESQNTTSMPGEMEPQSASDPASTPEPVPTEDLSSTPSTPLTKKEKKKKKKKGSGAATPEPEPEPTSELTLEPAPGSVSERAQEPISEPMQTAEPETAAQEAVDITPGELETQSPSDPVSTTEGEPIDDSSTPLSKKDKKKKNKKGTATPELQLEEPASELAPESIPSEPAPEPSLEPIATTESEPVVPDVMDVTPGEPETQPSSDPASTMEAVEPADPPTPLSKKEKKKKKKKGSATPEPEPEDKLADEASSVPAISEPTQAEEVDPAAGSLASNESTQMDVEQKDKGLDKTDAESALDAGPVGPESEPIPNDADTSPTSGTESAPIDAEPQSHDSSMGSEAVEITPESKPESGPSDEPVPAPLSKKEKKKKKKGKTTVEPELGSTPEEPPIQPVSTEVVSAIPEVEQTPLPESEPASVETVEPGQAVADAAPESGPTPEEPPIEHASTRDLSATPEVEQKPLPDSEPASTETPEPIQANTDAAGLADQSPSTPTSKKEKKKKKKGKAAIDDVALVTPAPEVEPGTESTGPVDLPAQGQDDISPSPPVPEVEPSTEGTGPVGLPVLAPDDVPPSAPAPEVEPTPESVPTVPEEAETPQTTTEAEAGVDLPPTPVSKKEKKKKKKGKTASMSEPEPAIEVTPSEHQSLESNLPLADSEPAPETSPAVPETTEVSQPSTELQPVESDLPLPDSEPAPETTVTNPEVIEAYQPTTEVEALPEPAKKDKKKKKKKGKTDVEQEVASQPEALAETTHAEAESAQPEAGPAATESKAKKDGDSQTVVPESTTDVPSIDSESVPEPGPVEAVTEKARDQLDTLDAEPDKAIPEPETPSQDVPVANDSANTETTPPPGAQPEAGPENDLSTTPSTKKSKKKGKKGKAVAETEATVESTSVPGPEQSPEFEPTVSEQPQVKDPLSDPARNEGAPELDAPPETSPPIETPLPSETTPVDVSQVPDDDLPALPLSKKDKKEKKNGKVVIEPELEPEPETAMRTDTPAMIPDQSEDRAPPVEEQPTPEVSEVVESKEVQDDFLSSTPLTKEDDKEKSKGVEPESEPEPKSVEQTDILATPVGTEEPAPMAEEPASSFGQEVAKGQEAVEGQEAQDDSPFSIPTTKKDKKKKKKGKAALDLEPLTEAEQVPASVEIEETKTPQVSEVVETPITQDVQEASQEDKAISGVEPEVTPPVEYTVETDESASIPTQGPASSEIPAVDDGPVTEESPALTEAPAPESSSLEVTPDETSSPATAQEPTAAEDGTSQVPLSKKDKKKKKKSKAKTEVIEVPELEHQVATEETLASVPPQDEPSTSVDAKLPDETESSALPLDEPSTSPDAKTPESEAIAPTSGDNESRALPIAEDRGPECGATETTPADEWAEPVKGKKAKKQKKKAKALEEAASAEEPTPPAVALDDLPKDGSTSAAQEPTGTTLPTEEVPVEEPVKSADVVETLEPSNSTKEAPTEEHTKSGEVIEPISRNIEAVDIPEELKAEEDTLVEEPLKPAEVPEPVSRDAEPAEADKVPEEAKPTGDAPVIEARASATPLREEPAPEAPVEEELPAFISKKDKKKKKKKGRGVEMPSDAAHNDKEHAPDAGARVPEGSEVKDVPMDLPATEDVPAVTEELAEPQVSVPGAEDLSEPTSKIHDPAMEEATKPAPSDEPVPKAEVSPPLEDPIPEEPPAAERSEATQEPLPVDDIAASSTSKRDKKKKKGKKPKSTDLDAAEPAQSSISPDKATAEESLAPAPEVSTEQLDNTKDVPKEMPVEVELPEQQPKPEDAVPETAEDFPTADIDPVSGEQDKRKELPPGPVEAVLEPEASVETPAGATEINTEQIRDDKLAQGEDGAEEWDLPSTKKGKKKKDKKRGKSISDAIAEDPGLAPTDSAPQDIQDPVPSSESTQLEAEPVPLEVAEPDEPEPTIEESSSTKSKKKKKKGKKGTSEATTPAVSRPESPILEEGSAPAADVTQEPRIVDEPIAVSPEAVEGDKQESGLVLGTTEPGTARAGPVKPDPEIESGVKEDEPVAERDIIKEADSSVANKPESAPAVKQEADETTSTAEPSAVAAPEPIVEPETYVPIEDTPDLGLVSKKKGKKNKKKGQSVSATPVEPRPLSPVNDDRPGPVSEGHDVSVSDTRAADISTEPTREESVATVQDPDKGKDGAKWEEPSDTTTHAAPRAMSPTLEEKTDSLLPAPTETQQVEDEWALPSKKKGKKKAKKAKTENEQPSEQTKEASLPEEAPSETAQQLIPLLKPEPDVIPSDVRDPEAPADFSTQPARSTPASPIETRETRLIPAQTTSHITHEAPSGEVARPEKKLKTDDMDSLMLSEPVMSIEEPVADVAPKTQDAQKELTLDKGKDVDFSFTRDMDDKPQSDEAKAVVGDSTAIEAAAAATGVSALTGKSKKKGKKKKAVDERKERDGDLVDNSILEENNGKKALTGGEDNTRDNDGDEKGADRGGFEVGGGTHAVPMEFEKGMGEVDKGEDVVMPAVVEEAGTDVVEPVPEERMETPEVVDLTAPEVVEEPATGREGSGSTDEVKTDAPGSGRTRGLIEEGMVEKEPKVITSEPVDEPKSESTPEPVPAAPRTPEMKAVPGDPEMTSGIPEATPERAGERTLGSPERALPISSVTDQPTFGQRTRGRKGLAPAWGEPEEDPVLDRGEGQRDRSLGGETSPIPPVTPTRDLASPDNSSRGLTRDALDASPFSPLRRSLSSNLEPVPEHPAEALDPPSESRERRPKKLPASAPDNTRDSGLAAEPTRLGQRGRWQQEGPHRDSGVHLKELADAPRQISPTPSGPRSMDPFKTPETSERRLKRSPRSAKDLREQEGPTSKTPVLRGPSPQAPTPEPQKSLRDYKTPDNFRSRYQDLGTPSLPAKKPSSPGPARPSALPRPSTRSPASGRRSVSDNVSQSRLTPSPDAAPRRVASNTGFTRHRTPEPPRMRPDTPGSIRSLHSATPPLRRAGRRISGDLRSISLSQRDQAEAPPATDSNDEHRSAQSSTPVANEGRVRSKDMTDVYDGYGEGRIGSPRSPTRPHSMRRRQSMQVIELESQVNELLAQNQMLQQERQQYADQSHMKKTQSLLADRDAEIDVLKRSVESLNREVSRLVEVNEGLNAANAQLSKEGTTRYRDLELVHAKTSRELETVRGAQGEFDQRLQDKDAEIADLRGQLETAKAKIREMQQRILETSRPADADFLDLRDVDYFDRRCQQLCQHTQQWVLRFSKFSDMRSCRLTNEINDEKIIDRLDNTILDGSDVDTYLRDRVRRRDVFMSMTMNMVWEFVFTRYLFGMDREQRQKLKSLEKHLTEVGPLHAVRQWRAVTLTLLSRRPAFKRQRELDSEAVVQAILETLSTILPPPTNLEDQIQSTLRRVMAEAVDLAVMMRTQRAEYMMLPPLEPKYDADGELAETVTFNASLMNERGPDRSQTNEELEAQSATVRLVLFPLIVRKGDESGVGEDEVVVCPAQVLVARSRRKPRGVTPNSELGGVPVSSIRGPSTEYLGTEL